MNTWPTFSNYLSIECSDQAWDDYQCLHADDLIKTFTDADWSSLAEGWLKKPEIWQIRCAGVLASTSHEAAVAVALDMVQKGSSAVAICAADALRAMLGRKSIKVPEAVIERVVELKLQVKGLLLKSLSQLEQRLNQ